MSEDDVKVGGLAHLLKFLVFGAVFIGLLFALAAASHHHQLITHPALVNFSERMAAFFKKYDTSAALGLIVITVILFSVLTGLLLNDLLKKFSIITAFIFLVMTLIDIAAVQFILSDNGII